MTILSEFVNEAKTLIRYRKHHWKEVEEIDREAPKVGDLAPDFTLSDISGTETITLSEFRGEKPVALVFGSFT